MLIALRDGMDLFLAGQMSTQMPHPVQSSADIWIVNSVPAKSLSLVAMCLKLAGAFSRRAGS